MITLADKNNTEELKKFARTMIWAFPAVFSLLLPWLFNYQYHWWPLCISAMLGLMYFTAPSLIYYPYKGWMSIALVLGWINTRIILSAVFFLLIWPMGLALRLFKKLQYRNQADHTAQSYYVKRTEKTDNKRLEYPF